MLVHQPFEGVIPGARGAVLAALFGSTARGASDGRCDVDLAVIATGWDDRAMPSAEDRNHPRSHLTKAGAFVRRAQGPVGLGVHVVRLGR